MSQSSQQVDVAIIGGGLIGASLAVALAESRHKVMLIEAEPLRATAAAWDERCIALNDTSRRIFDLYGLWPTLAPQSEPLIATHISEQNRFATARFDAAELGLDALGFNVPMRVLGATLNDALKGTKVQVLRPASVIGLKPQDRHVGLTVEEDGIERSVTARLAVAADGATSGVRRQLGIEVEHRDYGQDAIVTAAHATRPHGGVAYERFRPDGPLALVPKPGAGDAVYSVILTVPTVQGEMLKHCAEEGFMNIINREMADLTGPLRGLGRRISYPLQRVIGRRQMAGRVVFVGNAAQALHPVAAQGFNLGLRDVAGLADLIRAAADPGDAELLRGFVASRRRDRAQVSDLTDLMVRVFSNRIPLLAQTRQLGLLAIDRIPPLRRRVIDQHLGRLGLPASLQGRP